MSWFPLREASDEEEEEEEDVSYEEVEVEVTDDEEEEEEEGESRRNESLQDSRNLDFPHISFIFFSSCN